MSEQKRADQRQQGHPSPRQSQRRKKRGEGEKDEPYSNESDQSSPTQSHEPTDSDPDTGDDEIPPLPTEESPQEAYGDDEDEGLVDPFSSEATEAFNFIKSWLLLPEELSALEVFYQVANLRDALTFIPLWVPTKHSMVRGDEPLLFRTQPVSYDINKHFVEHLRSLRWRELLQATDALVGAADRAWLESFLREMVAPALVAGAAREHHGPGKGEYQRGRRSALHQVEAAEPLRPHEEEAVRATNRTLWTRHAHEAATATVQAIYDNTGDRAMWIDSRAGEVQGELEEMGRSVLRLLYDLTSLESNVGSAVEAHGQEYAHMARRIQQGLP
ncbi:hypothetical protein PG994_010781 [Apiospora phragmitis]|uniref:Uncharacterized protein n=1 Tax=Apiospora phragmitis TaxID=2905665 RepID=A0ABR1TQY0_9PEZI